MRQMESRQRVSSILNSQAFREELESIIADQLKHGPHPSSLMALQQISELLLPNPNSRWQHANSMGKGKIFAWQESLFKKKQTFQELFCFLKFLACLIFQWGT